MQSHTGTTLHNSLSMANNIHPMYNTNNLPIHHLLHNYNNHNNNHRHHKPQDMLLVSKKRDSLELTPNAGGEFAPMNTPTHTVEIVPQGGLMQGYVNPHRN